MHNYIGSKRGMPQRSSRHPIRVVRTAIRPASVEAMALLSAAMRSAAFTESSRPIGAWMQGRQWGRWGDQWVADRARPPVTRRAQHAGDQILRLEQLHAAGVIDDAEFARLRDRVRRST
jgi:hypothetical protein